jgi:hypothetical protein
MNLAHLRFTNHKAATWQLGLYHPIMSTVRERLSLVTHTRSSTEALSLFQLRIGAVYAGPAHSWRLIIGSRSLPRLRSQDLNSTVALVPGYSKFQLSDIPTRGNSPEKCTTAVATIVK